MKIFGCRLGRAFVLLALLMPSILLGDIERLKSYSGNIRSLYVERDLKKADLVDIRDYIPNILLDMRYATSDSMFHQPVYDLSRCFVRKELALKLQKVQRALKKYQFQLKMWDCYRPWSVQKKMWQLYPKKGYVAHPSGGSNHNRGCAVDVTLADLNGKELQMPTKFDDLSKKANHSYKKLSQKVLRRRWILKKTMLEAGLKPIRTEWWHYNLPKPRRYAVIDIPLSLLDQQSKKGALPSNHPKKNR